MKPALFAFSLVFAISALATPRVEFAASAERVACYDFVEIRLDVGNSAAKNPFTDVTVAGTFGPSGETPLAVDGFCDSADGRVFRIRFMPAKPGAYDYIVTYREGGFAQQHRGQFQAVDQRKRGLVRLDPEYPSHFQWEGTQERFFWNGTTAYFLAGWDDDTIRASIERLDLHKITRVRAALTGRVADGRTWFEPVTPSDNFTFRLEPWVAANSADLEQPGFDVSRFNVGYWQKWEKLLAAACARDMAVSVVFYVDGSRPGVDPFGKSGMGGIDEQRYYRYAIARFGAYANVMWDLANEYRLFRDDAWAEKMGAFVKEWDPYDHLTSTHGHDDFRFRQSPWADFALHQSWDEHGGYDFMFKNRREQAQTGRVIPQINEEYGYEDHYPQGWGENRTAPARSAETRARLAWEICLAGGYQTTGERATSEHGGGWINGRGDDSMTMLERYGHLYDFFTGIRWWELEPAPELVASVQPLKPGNPIGYSSPRENTSGNPIGYSSPRENTSGNPIGYSATGAPAEPKVAPRTFAARNPAGDLAAIYVRDGGIVTIKSDLLKDQLKPLWFSPRDGGMRNARALRGGGYRTPTAEDWVLLFRTPCNCSFRDFDNEFEQ